MSEAVFIGLMSGTSLDGVDGVAARFGTAGGPPRILAHEHLPFAPSLAGELASLNASGVDETHRSALAGNALARCYAGVVEALLAKASLDRSGVVAVGCHGQTVRHRPGEFDGTGYTVQLGAPALLAELCGIDVVADFRSRDVAAGGQGAPLAPAFHRAFFARPGRAVAVLNLGGIANVTVLSAAGDIVAGFDSGPANGLLDLWSQRAAGRPFDDGGRVAASGMVDARLLDALLDEPYFRRQPPKSTGRDLFNAAWLEARLVASDAAQRLPPADVQATLSELTACTVVSAVVDPAWPVSEVIACGGGARNGDLMARLARLLAPRPVLASEEHGLPADQIEAAGFAWLARAFVAAAAIDLGPFTGARGPRRLGALYPA